MSWLLCCIRPERLGESPAVDERRKADGAAKLVIPSKATNGNSSSIRLRTSLEQGDESSMSRPLTHAPSSRVRKASQHGLRLSEDTLISALSTTPTSLNALGYVFPFVNDEKDELRTGHTREQTEVNAVPHSRSKVDFADLCGSLEDLVYLSEGSNGMVYSAFWHGARVAVKFLLGNNDDSAHLQRCMTEAVLTRVLSHPCVVQCFATAIAQLTPEVWEAIRARCRRHQSILQSCSLGRSVAVAVQQQEQQERASLDVWEQQQQLSGDRRQSSCNIRPQCSLQPSRQSPRQSPPSQQSQHPLQQHDPQQQQLLSGTPSQAQQLLQSQERGSACRSGIARECSSDQAILEMYRVPAFFGEDINPPLRSSQQQQQNQQCQVGPRLQLSMPSHQQRPQSGLVGGSEILSDEGDPAGGGEGISLMQALVDLKAELGRHCTMVVMEYMDAGTLHQAIIRGDFSARRAVEHRSKLLALLLTAQELAQGMAHLHGLDILHGDLKPTNVLLKGSPCQFASMANPGQWGGPPAGGLTCTDPRGYTTKIADLGLARPCSEEPAELSSDQWGALAYLAPEAAKGSCCKASDVYSFGVMLWEMSAGVRPYLGLTTPQVLMGLVTGTLQLTWPSDGSLYAPLRSLAIACTDFNPLERPTFQVAARILGRMVKHIRSASEPLRQRHSSALSVEAASAAAAAAAAATATATATCGGGSSTCQTYSGGVTGGGGGGAKCMLSHDSRSMPLYLPTAVTEAAANSIACVGSLQPGSSLPRAPLTPPAFQAGTLAVASQSCSDDVGSVPSGISAPWPFVPRPPAGPMDSWKACSSGVATASGSCSGHAPFSPTRAATMTGGGSSIGSVATTLGGPSGSGTMAAGTAPGGPTGASAAAAGTFWSAAAMQSNAQPHPHPYPRTRRAAGSGVCGGAVLRSPLGAAAITRAPEAAFCLPPPLAPCDSRDTARQPMDHTAAERTERARPGSSPAQSQFLEASRFRGGSLERP